MVSKVAAEKGCQQVLWLLGEDERITEVGTMNIMLFWKNEKGGEMQFLMFFLCFHETPS